MLKTEGIPTSKDVPLSECEIRDDRFYFQNRLYVPGRELQTPLIQTAHDSVEGGHPGKNSLLELLSRDYWWQNLHYDVKMFVRAALIVAETTPPAFATKAHLNHYLSLFRDGERSPSISWARFLKSTVTTALWW